MPRPPRGWGRAQNKPRPDGTLRRSQAVTTFGPGAMMDLVHQAVLVGGLDFWSWDKSEGATVLQEPRLRDVLAARFEQVGRALSVEAAFREPPAGDDRDPARAVGVQVLEFPAWFVCQNPRCRALVGAQALELKAGRYHHRCDSKTNTECVPVRFLGACRRGHCEDWPWIAFAHLGGKERCASPDLVLEEGPSGDFSTIIVRCRSCENSQALSAAYSEALAFRCNGHRPWLGSEGREACEEPRLRLLVRTASNSYFPQVVSALSVPDPSHELDERVASVWDILIATTKETLPSFLTIPKVKDAVGKYAHQDTLAAIERRRAGARAAREPLRTAEYRQFLGSQAEVGGEQPATDDPFFARRVQPRDPLPTGVGRLIVASKLREVRAQIGFSRIDFVSPNLQGEFDLAVESAMLGLQTDWLPATEIRGEGVFIELDPHIVSEWEARPAVVDRQGHLLEGWRSWITSLDSKTKPPPFPGARFFLLHSLAHLLISAISLECGYAASAIRERIYCSKPGESFSMSAVLLSTGTSGTEGTLGGLVEQGRSLRAHLRRAYDLGILCSNDPVCAGHTPKADAQERFLEGAACHGCLFVAECSCEWFNRYLDRALVVPTIGMPRELAFFGERP